MNGFVKNNLIKRNKFTTLPVKSIEFNRNTRVHLIHSHWGYDAFTNVCCKTLGRSSSCSWLACDFDWVPRLIEGQDEERENNPPRTWVSQTLPKDYFNSTYISDIYLRREWICGRFFWHMVLFFCNSKSFDSSCQICLRSRLSQAYRYHDRMSRISLSRKKHFNNYIDPNDLLFNRLHHLDGHAWPTRNPKGMCHVI